MRNKVNKTASLSLSKPILDAITTFSADDIKTIKTLYKQGVTTEEAARKAYLRMLTEQTTKGAKKEPAAG